MKESRGTNFLSIVILLAIAGGAYFLVQSIRDTTTQTVAPFQEANSQLQTQVSNLMHPTPTIIPDPATYITQVQALARLETIQYSVEQVVTVEVNQGTFGFLFGDKMLFVGHGTVIAGIDMGKVQASDMQMQNGVLHVRLPASEVFVATLDNGKSQVYDRTTGALTRADPNLETLARQAAEKKILQAALDDGILDVAEKNAQAYLTRFFAALGYPNAVIEFAPAD